MDAKKEDTASRKAQGTGQAAAPADADAVEAGIRPGGRRTIPTAKRNRSEAAGAASRTNGPSHVQAGAVRGLEADGSAFVSAGVVEITRADDAVPPPAEAVPAVIAATGEQTVSVSSAAEEASAEAAIEAVTGLQAAPNVEAANEAPAQVVPEPVDQVAPVDQVVHTTEARIMPANEEAQVATRHQETIEAAKPPIEQAAKMKKISVSSRDDSRETSRTALDGWAMSAEASLCAVLNVQAVTLSAGMSLIAATNAAYRDVAVQWSALAHRNWKTALEVWQSNLRSS